MEAREAALLKRNEEVNQQATLANSHVSSVLKKHDERLEQIKQKASGFMDADVNDVQGQDAIDDDDENNHEPHLIQKTAERSKSRGGRIKRKPSKKELLAEEDNNIDEDDALTSDLSAEATVRYQKARLRVLQDENDRALNDMKKMKLEMHESHHEVKSLSDQNAKLSKKIQSLQSMNEKFKSLHSAAELKQTSLETELVSLKHELHELRQHDQQLTKSSRTKDIRLNRALEEVEKYKEKLHEMNQNTTSREVPKKEHEKLVREHAHVEKQKNELLKAFKKQMKLIDILKRQKLHLEAAKLLSFTEEEFTKVLDMGNQR